MMVKATSASANSRITAERGRTQPATTATHVSGSYSAPTSTTTLHLASTSGSRDRTTLCIANSGSMRSIEHASTSSQWNDPW